MNTRKLNKKTVNRLIDEKDLGAYCLGNIVKGSFEPKYAGRSDNSLKSRLFDHIRAGKYLHFLVWKTSTIFEAFCKECELFHNIPSLENKMHPDAPRHLPYFCPFCQVHENFKNLNLGVSQ